MVVAWKKSSHSWWFDSQNIAKRNTWLQTTLSELDEKTKTMLQLIEEDADSFAQRAELYYKKRPELINMVEDFYRAHRSLAVRFDQVKSEPKHRLLAPMAKSYDQFKNTLSKTCQPQKFTSPMEKPYDCHSEISYSESWESEVDDPEQEEHHQVDRENEEEEECGESVVEDPIPEENIVSKVSVSERASESELEKLREEIERLQEENRIQKEQLMQKDEEKREVIRQLSSSLEILKENVAQLSMRSTSKESAKAKSPLDLNKFKGLFSGKLFGWSSKPQTSIELCKASR